MTILTDTARLDWLERMANKPDGIHLHDGRPDHRFQCLGLGLRPGSVARTLRGAIDDAMDSDERRARRDNEAQNADG